MRRLAVLVAVLASVASTATAEAKRLVRYDVVGGLAGRYDRLFIDTDRSARQSSRRGSQHYKVSSKHLLELKRELKAARFSSLKHSYRPKYVVNDGIAQTVTYRGRAVTVYTGSHFPPRLHTVLRRLGRLMRY